jgi:hypothetical protein
LVNSDCKTAGAKQISKQTNKQNSKIKAKSPIVLRPRFPGIVKLKTSGIPEDHGASHQRLDPEHDPEHDR